MMDQKLHNSPRNLDVESSHIISEIARAYPNLGDLPKKLKFLFTLYAKDAPAYATELTVTEYLAMATRYIILQSGAPLLTEDIWGQVGLIFRSARYKFVRFIELTGLPRIVPKLDGFLRRFGDQLGWSAVQISEMIEISRTILSHWNTFPALIQEEWYFPERLAILMMMLHESDPKIQNKIAQIAELIGISKAVLNRYFRIFAQYHFNAWKQ